MISPGFFGLYDSQRALMASQLALNTINHNIANANTKGYTRQRVDLAAAAPYTSPGLSNNVTLGQLGQGVEATGLSRIRDTFLDTQFQQETSLGQAAKEQSAALNKIESILGEPSETGLNNAMQVLFESVQDLVTDPQSLTARTSFFQQANEMLATAQQQGRQLLNLHANLVGVNGQPATFKSSQLGITVDNVNARLEQIASLNKEILSITSAGGAPNDLMDKRDLALDELSKLGNFTITPLPNNQLEISLGSQVLVRTTRQLNSLQLVQNTGPNAAAVPVQVSTVNSPANVTANFTSGQVRGLLDAAGDSTTSSTVYGTFSKLDTLIDTLANAFNAVQQTGRDLNGTRHATGVSSEIFNTTASYPGTGPRLLYVAINSTLTANPGQLALAANDPTFTGGFGGVGDNRNALLFNTIRDTAYPALNNQKPESFHQTLVAQLGIDTKAARDRNESQASLVEALDGRRQEESGVNMDEETIDLLRYQRAFEASSRMIKALNEVYQTIINMV